MRNKLLKKVLTAVLAAAMLMSGNGFTMDASAADKIYVDQVLAKSYKETMSTGTTKQLQVFIEPDNATIKKLNYSSSNRKVATVSPTGLVTALSPGTTTISIKALDGSSKSDTVKLTVLKDLIITKANVDSDNEVIVLDENYGNVTVDSSVGDAVIYLSGITVKNVLTLESGDYTLNLYDSTANKVVIDEAKDEIVSLAAKDEETKAPKLNVGGNTEITEIQAKVNSMIKQEDGSQIEGLRFEQNKEGKITIYLEAYTGKILLDSSLGDLEVVTTGCNIAEVFVTGGNDAGNVALTNGGDSAVENVILTGKAKLELAVPATNVNVNTGAKGASLTVKDSVGTITNNGAEASIKVAGSVDNFVSGGAKAVIEVAQGGYVGTIDIQGSGSTLTGTGEVSEAYVNAADCKVDTVNTLVVVGNVNGTTVQGNTVSSGSSTTTQPPVAVGGGGGTGGSEEPEKEIKVGDVIVANDFEDGKSKLTVIMGSDTVSAAIANGGKDSDKALYVSNRTESYHGVGYFFGDYIKKHVTVRIKFDINCSEPATGGEGNEYRATMKTAGTSQNYHTVASVTTGDADTWYTMEGTFDLISDFTEASLYIETTGSSSYYLDNVMITVDKIGDPIPVTGISLDPNTPVSIDKGETLVLNPVIAPANADNKNVTWSSSDDTIATVSNNGIVTGIKAGTVTITVTTADGNYTATREITVTDNVAFSLDMDFFILQSIGETLTISATVTEGVVWTSSVPSVATVTNGVVTSQGNGRTMITAEVGGKTASCEIIVADAIIYYHGFYLDENPFTSWPDNTISGPMQNGGTLTVTNGYLNIEATQGYHGIGYKFNNSVNKIYKIIARVKNSSNTVGQKVQFMDQTNSSSTLQSYTISGTEWTTIEYTATLAANSNKIICLSPSYDNGTLTYYVDDFIVIDATADVTAEPITDITLNKTTLSKEVGKSERLILTVEPASAITDYSVEWTSDNPAIATVSNDGTVTAVSPGGPVTITANVTDNTNSATFTATCEVTVTEAVPYTATTDLMVSFNDIAAGTPYDMIGWSPSDGSASVVTVSGSAIQALEIRPTAYNNTAKFSITLPDGVTLKDYKQITFKVFMQSGDIGYKTIIVEAGTTLSSGFAYSAARKLGEYYRSAGVSTEFETITIDLNNVPEALQSLSGTIELAIGINCDASMDGAPTAYLLDDIILVPHNPIPTINFNHVAAGTQYDMIGWSPSDGSASVVTVSGSAIQALEVRPTAYNNAAKFSITLPEGKTISDYGQISFKVFMQSGDIGYKTIVVEAGTTLSSGFANNAARKLGEYYRSAGESTEFETITIDLSTAPAALQSLSGAIELAIGINCDASKDGIPTVYLLDDIQLIP